MPQESTGLLPPVQPALTCVVPWRTLAAWLAALRLSSPSPATELTIAVAASSAGRSNPQGRSTLVVEALGCDLTQRAVPELDLEIEVIPEAPHGVDGDEREAAVLHRGLVEHLVVELRRNGDRAAHQRKAPYQRDVAAALTIRAPGADHVVGDVDLPVWVVLGGDVGEVGVRAQVGGLAILGPFKRDPAEVLDRRRTRVFFSVAALRGYRLHRPAGRRHVDAPAPTAIREPLDRLAIEPCPGLAAVRITGLDEPLPKPLLEAPVWLSLLGRVGDEAGEGARNRRAHGQVSLAVTSRSQGLRLRVDHSLAIADRQPSAARTSAAARSGG